MNAVDTNILVHAASSADPAKAAEAVAFLETLDASETLLLWQVACEFVAVMIRHQNDGRSNRDAVVLARELANTFHLVTPSGAAYERALEIRASRAVAWWGALIIASCAEAGVKTLYSEDLPGVFKHEVLGVRVINPLASSS